MPGYDIFELRYLKTHQGAEGLDPHENKIGLLDFLRELKSGAEGIARNSSYLVMGLDEVLYLAGREERRETALFIHTIFQIAAQALQRKNIEVQIVCKGTLIPGDSLWLKYRGEEISLNTIFGTPTKRDIRNCPVYFSGFNLSS